MALLSLTKGQWYSDTNNAIFFGIISVLMYSVTIHKFKDTVIRVIVLRPNTFDQITIATVKLLCWMLTEFKCPWSTNRLNIKIVVVLIIHEFIYPQNDDFFWENYEILAPRKYMMLQCFSVPAKTTIAWRIRYRSRNVDIGGSNPAQLNMFVCCMFKTNMYIKRFRCNDNFMTDEIYRFV